MSKPGIAKATPRVLGWDAAGVVKAVGSETVLFKSSDEVFYAGSVTRPTLTASFIWWMSGSPDTRMRECRLSREWQ
jgi:NADPH:quinone reductase-like Zn-dependent oxidoreductase